MFWACPTSLWGPVQHTLTPLNSISFALVKQLFSEHVSMEIGALIKLPNESHLRVQRVIERSAPEVTGGDVRSESGVVNEPVVMTPGPPGRGQANPSAPPTHRAVLRKVKLS